LEDNTECKDAQP